MAWFWFALAFVAFFLSHSLPVRPPLRPILVRALGPRGFTLAYSLLSLAVLGWLIIAAAQAPFVLLWPWAPWQTHLALALMLGACLVLAFALGRPNPFSFGGAQNDKFDPARPGIVRLSRHPLLLTLALWALAHLLVNGDLAHVILFATFAGFALFGGRLIARRKRREMGARWGELRAAVAQAPLGPGLAPLETLVRGLSGFLLYALLIAAHPAVIGVTPLP